MPDNNQPPIRVLFGYKPEWFGAISGHLSRSRFAVDMGRLDQVALSDWDLVIPMTLDDQRLLNGLPVTTRIARCVPQPSRDLCNDKLMLNRWLIANGFGAVVPPMYDAPPQDLVYYPLIRKSRRRSWGYGCQIVDRPTQIDRLDPDTEFLQSMISSGNEWAAHMAFQDGALIFARAVHHWMAQPGLILGNSHKPVKSHHLPDIPHLPLWHDIAQALGITDGTICIDFAVINGRPYLFEINPRVGGSMLAFLPEYLEQQWQVLASHHSHGVTFAA